MGIPVSHFTQCGIFAAQHGDHIATRDMMNCCDITSCSYVLTSLSYRDKLLMPTAWYTKLDAV